MPIHLSKTNFVLYKVHNLFEERLFMYIGIWIIIQGGVDARQELKKKKEKI